MKVSSGLSFEGSLRTHYVTESTLTQDSAEVRGPDGKAGQLGPELGESITQFVSRESGFP